MADDSAFVKGLVSAALPTVTTDGNWAGARQTKYGEQFFAPIGNWRHALADQGTYFIAHNATNDAATTLAGHIAPVLVDADATMTKPLVFMRNSSAYSQNLRCYLDFIEIEVISAGASGTTANWAAETDTGATRVTTAGEVSTIVNPNMQSTALPALAVQCGAVVVGAEGPTVRYIGHGQLRPAIEFAGDRTTFRFGGDPSSGANTVLGAAIRSLVNLPPVILGSTDQFLLALYAPSQAVTAGVYKVRMGWWEL